MQLYQFGHSPFCRKVRLLLAAKGLEASLIEVVPGLGQLELFRLSGQRQVPVLVDGAAVIADSTAIALHLEARHPEPPLLPADPAQRARVLLLEDWADVALAPAVRAALLQAAAHDSQLRAALLPAGTPLPLRGLIRGLPAGLTGPLADLVGDVVSHGERPQLRRHLEQLNQLVQGSGFLVGERLSLADIAVAAQLEPLRFPEAAGEELAGLGVAGLADDPALAPLFRWRDALLTPLARA